MTKLGNGFPRVGKPLEHHTHSFGKKKSRNSEEMNMQKNNIEQDEVSGLLQWLVKIWLGSYEELI